MEHGLIDQYSDRESFIHRLDPRTKLVTTLALVLTMALAPLSKWPVFVSCFVVIIALIALSRVSFVRVFKRSLAVMPFVLMVAIFAPFFKEGEAAGTFNVWLWQITVTQSGLAVLASVVARAWLSILALIWLTSTTRIPLLLQGLEQLHMPRIMVMILSSMYRYLYVVIDETMRMKQARDSRNFGGKRLWQIRTIGNIIGTLFIRSYERGERVYAAMVARGFDGQRQTLDRLSFRKADAYFGMSIGLVLISSGAVGLLIFV